MGMSMFIQGYAVTYTPVFPTVHLHFCFLEPQGDPHPSTEATSSRAVLHLLRRIQRHL
jgi:hypothetical protein